MIARWLIPLVVFSFSLSAKPLQVDITAKAAILINADTGAILYEKHSHLPVYPASITKVATALYALEQKQLDAARVVTVSGESLKMKPPRTSAGLPSHWLESDGTSAGLRKGEQVTVETLLHGMMLVSGNDAANVLAETASGSIPLFVEELNAYLKTIGCLKTNFHNPHGLHHPEHMTTAYDMALIAQRALRIPLFRDVVRKPLYVKPKSNKQPEIEFRQSNQFLRNNKHNYAKAIGVKTGYLSQAQHTLVAAAVHEERTLIAVLFGCQNRIEYSDARKLFETAFAEKKMRRIVFTGQESFERPVEGAKTALVADLVHEVVVDYYPAEEPDLKAFIHWTTPPLPIVKGQVVGEMRLVDDKGNVFQTAPLYARSEVKGTFLFVLKEKWNQLLR